MKRQRTVCTYSVLLGFTALALTATHCAPSPRKPARTRRARLGRARAGTYHAVHTCRARGACRTSLLGLSVLGSACAVAVSNEHMRGLRARRAE